MNIDFNKYKQHPLVLNMPSTVKYLLERITFPDTIFVDEFYQQYTCGRGKKNHILCNGKEISRNHCSFMRSKEGLFVCDSQSLNGVYLNGKRIRPNCIINIKENDTVGIGCSDLQVHDEFKFVYKVKTSVKTTNKSIPNEVFETNSINQNSNGKRLCQANEESIIPNKMNKLDGETIMLMDHSDELEIKENITSIPNTKPNHNISRSSNILFENYKGKIALLKEEPKKEYIINNENHNGVLHKKDDAFSHMYVVNLSDEESNLPNNAPTTHIVEQKKKQKHEVITISDSENKQHDFESQKLHSDPVIDLFKKSRFDQQTIPTKDALHFNSCVTRPVETPVLMSKETKDTLSLKSKNKNKAMREIEAKLKFIKYRTEFINKAQKYLQELIKFTNELSSENDHPTNREIVHNDSIQKQINKSAVKVTSINKQYDVLKCTLKKLDKIDEPCKTNLLKRIPKITLNTQLPNSKFILHANEENDKISSKSRKSVSPHNSLETVGENKKKTQNQLKKY